MNGRTNTNGIIVNRGIVISLEPVTSLVLSSQDSKAIIAWSDPVDKVASPGGEDVGHWIYSVLVRNIDHVPEFPTDGVQVVKSTIRNQYSGSGYEDSGLENNTTYYYSVFAYNHIGVPSDPASGEVTPEEIFNLVYLRQISTGVPNGYYCTESTLDSVIICENRYESSPAYYSDNNVGKQIDSNLVTKSFTPLYPTGVYVDPTTEMLSPSWRIGNRAMFRTTDNDNNKIFSVNSDLIQNEIDTFAIFNADDNFWNETVYTACDVNGECGYFGVVAYLYVNPAPWTMKRYDSNNVGTNVSGFAYGKYYSTETTWITATMSTLSTTHNAVFAGMNFHTWNSNDHNGNSVISNTGYRYSVDGVQSQLNFQSSYGTTGLSRCADGFIAYGGYASQYNSENDNKTIYGFSSDFVATNIGEFTGYAHGGYDVQTNGVGVVVWGDQELYWNDSVTVDVYNKHFVKQNSFRISTAELYGKSAKCGDYILMRLGSTTNLAVLQN